MKEIDIDRHFVKLSLIVWIEILLQSKDEALYRYRDWISD